MTSPRSWFWCAVVMGLAVSVSAASAGVVIPPPILPTRPLDSFELAARIDALIDARLAENGVTPASPADDATFLRRVSLDLVGRIPTQSEARAFLEDDSPDKRERLVERLLAGAGFANHFARVWRDQMMPARSDVRTAFFARSFEAYLRQQLRDQVGYDQTVLAVIQGGVPGGRQQQVIANQASALSLFQALENKPDAMAAATARLFLGVNLECAQCHDHPFATWKREQFWELAAFFESPVKAGAGRTIAMPSGRRVDARFLDGARPEFKDNEHGRLTLGRWLTSADNPFFARAVSNQTWAYFFGVGIVDPVDAPGEDNPPSHPELLRELSWQFALSGFDVRHLVRSLVRTRAYQRTSVGSSGDDGDGRLFARMPVRGLSPEQLFDSLAQATGYRETETALRNSLPGQNTPRSRFLARFDRTERATETQTSILQALALMNGEVTDEVTSLDRSFTLGAVLEAPFFDDAGRLESLFLATLTRKPTAAESERLLRYLREGGPSRDPKRALADVFWVLLNSSEFAFNH